MTIKYRDIYDPRKPDWGVTVPTDSDHESHKGLRKTFILLSLQANVGKIFFVIEGVSSEKDYNELQEGNKYFYEEHTCPTNFIRVPYISVNGNNDYHGLFDFEEAVWQVNNSPKKYDPDYDAYLEQVFPQLQSNGLTYDD